MAELGLHATDLQRAKILERSNALRRRIDAWSEIQHLYMPAIAIFRARADAEGGGTPIPTQSLELFLPSQICDLVTCDIRFLRYEFDIRMTLIDATLTEIRGLLLMRSQMYKSKDRFSRGQRQQTRSQALISGVERRIRRAKERYDMIRSCLVQLSNHLLETSWKNKFRALHDDDMKGLTSLDDDGIGGEGHKKLTWIWRVEGVGANTNDSTHAGA